jgi:hypothetical protein
MAEADDGLVRTGALITAAALAGPVWPLAYLAGGRLAPAHAAAGATATVSAVDVAADESGACAPGNIVGDSPATLFFGAHVDGARTGLRLTLVITGPDGTADATSGLPADGGECAVVAAPAALGHARVWTDGDYAVAVEIGSPPVATGPVTAFEIAAGITDD